MKTLEGYYMILFVYILLWSCQLVACNLTHSLIILIDSYINLYKILDIWVGILHLNTQRDVGKRNEDDTKKSPNIDLFGRICTYQFKRLPVLGSFVNGLFLAAFLISAAIEGIQTCFHFSHLVAEGEKSILLVHPVTYPSILIGFALVSGVMQWCSNKVHEMREEELESNSLMNLNSKVKAVEELSVEQLAGPCSGIEFEPHQPPIFDYKRKSDPISLGRALSFCLPDSEQMTKRKFVLNSTLHRSFESVSINSKQQDKTQISLKSFKVTTNFENPNVISANIAIDSISKDIEAKDILTGIVKDTKTNDRWLMVRHCISPVALIICAIIVYFIHNELVIEIADATLAILVVILLFTSSYPPMKNAGKVLLQSAPDEVDLESLKLSLLSISPFIIDIKEIHVWSLTARSNRVATCHLVLDKDAFKSTKQVATLLREAKFKFSNQNIKCTTIQPVFLQSSSLETHLLANLSKAEQDSC